MFKDLSTEAAYKPIITKPNRQSWEFQLMKSIIVKDEELLKHAMVNTWPS